MGMDPIKISLRSRGDYYRLVLVMVIFLIVSACSSAAQSTFVPGQTIVLTPRQENPGETVTAEAPVAASTILAPTGTNTVKVLTHVATGLIPSAGCENGGDCPPPATSTEVTTSTPRPAFASAAWSSLPVIPTLSPKGVAILEEGKKKGNNPHAFSKIGDCESQTSWFLGDFDLGKKYYHLGPYETELAPVISYYSGSFNRLSQAAKPGFTAASLLSPLWSDRKLCQKNESPLACEYRLHKPAAAFIMLGTNDAVNPKTFEGHMRKIIEFSLAQGVLPILGTKADNVEGNHQINQTIARLAYEYDLPLWNFWLAVQDLPGKGLQEDGSHLTFAAPLFNDPRVMKKAWPVRNLNALQILSEVMQATR